MIPAAILALLKRLPWDWIIAACVIGAAVFYVYNRGKADEAQSNRIKQLEADRAAMAVNIVALQKADEQRATDLARITGSRKERDDAIQNAPTSAPGAASLALNCVRWKAANPGKQAPAACL